MLLYKRPECPSCRAQWTVPQIVTNRFAKTFIDSLPAHCINKACSVKDKLAAVLLHGPNCQLRDTVCKDCGKIELRTKIAEHKLKHCINRQATCSCGATMPFQLLQVSCNNSH